MDSCKHEEEDDDDDDVRKGQRQLEVGGLFRDKRGS